MAKRKRRPVKIKSHVWCDFHCTIHAREKNPYGFSEPDCRPSNWRQVYVLGNYGEEF